MTEMVEDLDLPELCKQSLKSRWLDQVIWADKKAEQCRQWHYRLRLTAIVGGVLLPAIVGINFELGKDNVFLRTWFPYLPFALSQVIAVSVAAEEFLRFGDRWRQYRQLAEDLKAEGWEYLQLSGPYSSGGVDLEDSPPPLPRHRMSEAKLEDWKAIKRKRRKNPRITHKDVYTLFAGRVESLINDDVQSYISALQQQQAKESEQIQQILEKAEEVSTDKSLFAKPEPPPPQLPPSQPANRSNNGYGAMGTPQPTPFNSPPPSNHPMMGQPSGYATPPAHPAMGQPTAYAAPPTPMAQPSGYAAPSTHPAMGQPTAYATPPAHPAMGQPTAYAA
ncbi:MAG TPA: DUF4231 domain-containing protein, partial [Oscillatoriales cyanobacterium M4454_W2019_049]|nr:DUF4231 domain-containing protein [Oscillatoriales cyanobacterium M4454_W2019_049]